MKNYSNLWKSAMVASVFLMGLFAFSACEDQAAEPDTTPMETADEVEIYRWDLPANLDLSSDEKVALIQEYAAKGDLTYATLEYKGTRDGYLAFLSQQASEENCSPWIKVSCGDVQWAYSSMCYGTCTYKQSCQNGNTITETYKTERSLQNCSYFNV